MKGCKIFLALFILSLLIYSCRQRKPSCQYKLDQLLAVDSSKFTSTVINDTTIEVRDKVKDSASFPRGIYLFDKKKNLRFYGFFLNEDYYYYSEQYDSIGNLIAKEGDPLIKYNVFRKSNDTVLFSIFLFALHKKYEDIEITTSFKDTIIPKYLYKSNLYCNIKCFNFKLKVAGKIKDLICYISGKVQNTCTLQKEMFYDTVLYKNIQFN